MTNFFSRHLKNVNESYFTHFRKAFGFAVCLFILSLKSLIHAIFPFFFETSTTDVVKKINKMIKKMKYPNRRVRFNV